MMRIVRWMRRHRTWSPQVAELDRDVNAKLDSLAAGVHARISDLTRHVEMLQRYVLEFERLRDLSAHDMMSAFQKTTALLPPSSATLETAHPGAFDTDDHKFPKGAANDNTRSPRFVAACERHFKRTLTALDLGCSGGGVVFDFVLRGHQAFGLEGSDGPRKAQRAEWRLFPDRLFACDITKPFRLLGGDRQSIRCDVVTAWEVLEHIADSDLPALFENVRNHLADGGLFVGSVTTLPDGDPATGAVYHRTVQLRPWWERRFQELGMRLETAHPFDPADFCRGTGNGWSDPNFRTDPAHGFHFVLSSARPAAVSGDTSHTTTASA
jgi:predicted TPR repeat methyltransferase